MTTDISTLLLNISAAKRRLEDTLLHNTDAILQDSVSRHPNISMTIYPYVDVPDAAVKVNISTSDGVSQITIRDMDIDPYTIQYTGKESIKEEFEALYSFSIMVGMLLYLVEHRYSHIALQYPPRDTPLGISSPEVEAAKELLGEAGYIGVYWHKMDIAGRAEELGIELTEGQVDDIACSIVRQHDCAIGLNWDVIDTHIEDYSADWAGIDDDND